MAKMSVATIDKPEFIKLQPLDINPLMSSCEIKVLYTGKNRNGSYITKEVATEMSKTLRGAPIVGWYREDKEDFMDHGDRVIFDGDGIKFECMTRPYGFVSPDAQVWFQNFEEKDDFGNVITREYLMTTGYLWTGQYEEAKKAVEGDGKPHSMELDNDSLQGKWSEDINSGMEFFIINDAIFSKLCILGDDVEPCFEGSKVSAPEVSKTFTKMDDDFKNTLFNMMQELKFALQGGTQMDNNMQTTSVEEQNVNTPATDFTAEQDKNEKTSSSENQKFTEEGSNSGEASTSFEKKDDKEDPKNNDGSTEDKKDDNNAQTDDNKDGEQKDDKNKEDDKKYSLLEEKYTDLEQKYTALQNDYQSLVEFKNQVDNEKKDALINSFYMLSDEDKKDVIENKAKYSLDDIEAKLSIICVRKKVNFDLDTSSKNDNTIEDKPATTFSLDDSGAESVPAWISALKNTQNNRNN